MTTTLHTSTKYLADTLSHGNLKSPNKMPLQEEFKNVRLVEDLDVQEDLLSIIKDATAENEDLKIVMELIQKGWPNLWDGAPMSAHLYFTVRMN